MGFEDDREDFWRGRGGDSPSKENFLKVAAQCGGVQTGFPKDGGEYPYYGATVHGEELACEGLVEKMVVESIVDGESLTGWMITPLGKIMAGRI
jgi:hypothetical protein